MWDKGHRSTSDVITYRPNSVRLVMVKVLKKWCFVSWQWGRACSLALKCVNIYRSLGGDVNASFKIYMNSSWSFKQWVQSAVQRPVLYVYILIPSEMSSLFLTEKEIEKSLKVPCYVKPHSRVSVVSLQPAVEVQINRFILGDYMLPWSIFVHLTFNVENYLLMMSWKCVGALLMCLVGRLGVRPQNCDVKDPMCKIWTELWFLHWHE